MCGQIGKLETGDKNKKNCQCDGNCDCGEVMPDGTISCDNCGWKAPSAYNALTGNHACPSCRTESPYSNNNVKPKNKEMNQTNQTRDNLSNGLVGLAAVNAGFLNWSKDPIGKSDVSGAKSESGFADNISSQNMIGYATGQDWMVMNPFGKGNSESGYASEDDQKWAEMFDALTQGFDQAESANNNTEESGMNLKDKLSTLYHSVAPEAILARDIWTGKYCKSLGYMKSDDKTGFKKCKTNAKIHFVDAKHGKWSYPPAPEGIEADVSVDQIAADTAKEVAAIPPAQIEAAAKTTGDMDATAGIVTPKSNTMMYIIVGFILLVIIIIAIIVMMRIKAKKAA